MKPGGLLKPVVATTALLLPSLAWAETHSEAYNGATCIPYPPFDASNAVPYSHFLYGFRQSAFCHFTIPNGWDVSNLSYVLFTTSVSSGTLRVRLCVYSGFTSTCGAERALTSSTPVSWVSPPSPIPTYASGGYLSISFPNAVSTFQQYHVVFYR